PEPDTGVTVRRGPGGAQWLVALMGGCERRGRWRLAARATSRNIMGGADLDLSQAELAADHVELTVFSLMGGADIYVPENLQVEVSEFAFMGGNSVRLGDNPRGTGPVIKLRLLSIMGGSDVKRGPKLSRAERRELRRQRHLGH
ncbi:MAG: LiaF domain-containing protein, partial [Solirubrobacteraceae bacterium]